MDKAKGERLQKYLARAGLASRRKSEELVRAGRVSVNGKTVTVMGTRINPHEDKVLLDGNPVTTPEDFRYFLINKPRQVLCSRSDPQGRPVITDMIPNLPGSVQPVGRLDWDAEGALLLTDDGKLANQLTHPSSKVAKTYLVKVKGIPTLNALTRLTQGVELEDGPTKPTIVFPLNDTGKNSWLRIILTEGRNRQIKRICEAVGHPVLKIIREDFAGLKVEELKPGQWRVLKAREVRRLKLGPQHKGKRKIIRPSPHPKS